MNIMVPLHNRVVTDGNTTIIRGQKTCDKHKSPLRDGDVVDGLTFEFPIEDWTDEQVMQYLIREGCADPPYLIPALMVPTACTAPAGGSTPTPNCCHKHRVQFVTCRSTTSSSAWSSRGWRNYADNCFPASPISSGR